MLCIEVLLLAIDIMDSLAVSVTGGAVVRATAPRAILLRQRVCSVYLNEVIGYTMGLGFEKYICAFDHWIAFTLLLYLGGKMIYDSTKEDGKFDPLCNRTLCGLGIATSIDAPRRRISLAILKISLLLQPQAISRYAFAISAFGVYFGNRFGKKGST